MKFKITLLAIFSLSCMHAADQYPLEQPVFRDVSSDSWYPAWITYEQGNRKAIKSHRGYSGWIKLPGEISWSPFPDGESIYKYLETAYARQVRAQAAAAQAAEAKKDATASQLLLK